MGFTPTRYDNNVWIKPREDGCNFIATHVDDFIVVAKDSKKHSDQIKKALNLSSECSIDFFLGHDIRQKNNGSWATSAKTSVHKTIAKEEQAMGEVSVASISAIKNDHSEEYFSASLNALGLNHHQVMIGCLNWIFTLGRMHIGNATISLARFSAGLREGHLARVLRIVGCLKKRPNLEIVHDPIEMYQTNNGRTTNRIELIACHPDSA